MPYARPTAMSTNGDTRPFPDSAEPSPSGFASGSTQISFHPRPSDSAWQHRLSATFAQLSDQFRDASQALSTISPPSEDAMASLSERLQRIEERQQKLEAEIRGLKECSPVIEELPAKGAEDLLKEHIDMYKLDQERLPSRLQNALATKSLSPIKMPPMKNRKFPPNSPATRGEFEHLTKERYEGLMASYDIPISGDTAAKRESLREFLGIPVSALEKK